MLEPNLIETLLHTPESNVADYKQAQYSLDDDVKKSELVKDIVAFANAWKASDAHILIGVEDGRGKRGIVHGVAHHLDDATVQQLINSKLNQPVTFAYVPATVDGKPIAIIRIAKDQKRPIYLTKKFGRLEAERVYVRQGSSTAVADPDEIARMGEARGAILLPQLTLGVGDPLTHEQCSPVLVRSTVLVDPPEPLVPDLLVSRLAALNAQADFNAPDPEEVKAYRRMRALISPLAFAVKNTGEVLLQDVRVWLEVPRNRGLVLLDDEPQKPEGRFYLRLPRLRVRRTVGTDVTERGKAWELVAYLGKVQTQATAWSEPFWIGSSVGCELPLVARVSADNLPRPVDVPLEFQFRVTEKIDYDEADPDEEDGAAPEEVEP